MTVISSCPGWPGGAGGAALAVPVTVVSQSPSAPWATVTVKVAVALEPEEIVSEYKYGFSDSETAVTKFDKGLSEQVVRDISELKNEPEWMTELRVKAYHHFLKRPMPEWGNNEMLNGIDFESIIYFLKSSGKTEKDWEDVPEANKNTFDR